MPRSRSYAGTTNHRRERPRPETGRGRFFFRRGYSAAAATEVSRRARSSPWYPLRNSR